MIINRIKILCLAVYILFCSSVLYGQMNNPMYRPFTRLYVIKTEKFDIIFPKESRRTAIELSKIADKIYNENSKLFNSKVRGRIPVSIITHINVFNGFSSPVPYATIVLYDTPMDGDFTTYKNNLEGLFLHELMHALSLSSENNGPQTIVFGNWFATTQLNNLGFTLEGVTVSYESLGGFGRANDPLTKEVIRQDIIENKFKTPIQATGVWDHLDGGSVIYTYGGLFAKYLQDKYGMEKYNQWWFKMARSLYFSLRIYHHGTYEAFRRVYGIGFDEAWNDFKNYISIGAVETNTERITKKETIINDVASYGDTVYFIDNNSAQLKAYNTKNNKTKVITGVDKSSESLSISSDGSKALIGSLRYGSGFYNYITREYDIKKKKYTKQYDNIRYATFFRDGIIGIDRDLNNTTLVYIKNDGSRELLLPPNNTLSYYYPNNIDDNRIALMVVEDGIKSLRILDYNKKTLSKINTVLANDNNIWKYIQYVNYADNKITFAYNDNDRLYKLGVIDLNNNKAIFYTNEYSGGVYNAISLGDNFYYTARFSTYYSLMKYPADTTAINTTYKENSINISAIENVAIAFEENTNNNNIKTYNYNPLKYISPFNTWFPIPLFNSTYRGNPFRFNGVGIFSIIANPTLDNFLWLMIGYDIPSKFLQTDISFKTYAFNYPVTIRFYDRVNYSYAGNYKYWDIGGSFEQSFRFDLWSDKAAFYFIPLLTLSFISMPHRLDDNSSAFTYKYWTSLVNLGSLINIHYLNYTMDYYRKDEISLKVFPEYSFYANSYYIDSELKLESRHVPLRFRAFGAYSPIGVSYDGVGLFNVQAKRGDGAFDEYVYKMDYYSTWIAGGDLELFHAFNIDKNLSHLYFNNIFISLIYSSSFYDIEYMHTIGFKLGTKVQLPIYGPYPVIAGEPYLRVDFKLPSNKNKLYGDAKFWDIVYFSFAWNFAF